MLTALFCLYSPAIAKQHDRLIRLAVSFRSRITNDEHSQGRVGGLPKWRVLVAAAGLRRRDFELRELAQGERSPQFQCGIQHLIGVAHGHLKDALLYTLLIPRARSASAIFVVGYRICGVNAAENQRAP
jgi:farnesyl-diphosphate farnesyltransferase